MTTEQFDELIKTIKEIEIPDNWDRLDEIKAELVKVNANLESIKQLIEDNIG